MNALTALFQAIEAIFTLANTLETNKYRDEYLKLKQRYYDEKNKPQINEAVIDDIEHRIFLLCGSVSAAALGGSKAPSVPG
jgi:hypothetical protein